MSAGEEEEDERPDTETFDQKEKGGPYVAVEIGQDKLIALIDTGASISIMHPDVYDRLPENNKPSLRPVQLHLTVANGQLVSVKGQADFKIKVAGSHIVIHRFMVAPMNVQLIIGYDFLTRFNCILDARKKNIELAIDTTDDEWDQYHDAVCKIQAAEDVMVPAGTEMIVEGDCKTDPSDEPLILEADRGLAFRQGLLIARSLVPWGERVPIRVANLSHEDQLLRKGTTLGVCETALNVMEPSKNGSPVPAYLRSVSVQPPSSDVTDLSPALQTLFKDSTGEINAEQEAKLLRFLQDNRKAFVENKEDLGRTGLVRHRIFTGEAAPIKQAPRRFPRAKKAAAEEEIKRMLRLGVIEPSCSPWASPVVLVGKKDGSLRFCIDYRRLNAVTRKDSFPLPRIDDTLDALEGSCWFSTLDLASGYWQVEMDPENSEKTAFVTHGGLWQFTVLPMGLSNSGATFQRLMEMVFKGLDQVAVLIYLDDLIVHARDFQGHLDNLQKVLNRLQDVGLKLSPKKCRLFRKEVEFLGHVVSNEGVKTDLKKTEAVQNWPTPKTVTDVRSFLGLCSYYRRFVRGFADIARPLHRLTEKKATFQWTEECQTAKDTLVQALTTAPILAYPKEEGPFVIDTDASGAAIGAVLSQVQDGEEKVILFYSRGLSAQEKNYCVTRRELLAVVDSVKHCHHFLYGAHFKVRTDHGALRWLLSFKNPEGQLARWLELLGTYDFNIEHRPGKKHTNADALSRRPCHQEDCNHCERKEKQEEQTAFLRAVHDVRQPSGNRKGARDQQREKPADRNDCWLQTVTEAELCGMQDEDEVMKTVKTWKTAGRRPPWAAVKNQAAEMRIYWTQWARLDIKDGLLVRWLPSASHPVRQYQVLAPHEIRRKVFDQLHHTRLGGHQGIKRTAALVQHRFWWPQQKNDIERWCQVCEQCQFRKQRSGPARTPLQQDIAAEPFGRIAMDILSFPTTTENGNTCVLVVSDYFTKWSQAYALADHQAYTVADVLVTRFFLIFGIPRVIHTDQGPEFQSELFLRLCDLLEAKKTRTSPYRPQSDGQVERLNRTLIDMLSKFCDDHKEDWDHHLPYILCSYNSTRHDSTGCSPNLLMMGREITLPIDLMYGTEPATPTHLCPVEYVEWVRQTTAASFDFAREHLQKAAERQKRNYDKGARERLFERGQWVLRFYPPNLNKNKLNSRYVGPYLVLGKTSEVNYEIQSSKDATSLVVHVDHLKPFYTENPPISWICNDVENQKGTQTEPDVGMDQEMTSVETDNSHREMQMTTGATTKLRRTSRTRRPPDRLRFDH